MTVTDSVLPVIPCQASFDDAMALIAAREYYGQAALAHQADGHIEDAAWCRRQALDTERQLARHADAALSGAWC